MEKYDLQIGPGRKLGARLLLGPKESEGGIALVLHTLPPKSLAAPPHRHSREDEYSYVTSGTLTVWEEGKVTRVPAGQCILKARNILHTFWNEEDEPLTFLEVMAPGDFAEFFREVDKVQPDGPFSEEDVRRVGELSERYGLSMDFAPIPDIMAKHGLVP